MPEAGHIKSEIHTGASPFQCGSPLVPGPLIDWTMASFKSALIIIWNNTPVRFLDSSMHGCDVTRPIKSVQRRIDTSQGENKTVGNG